MKKSLLFISALVAGATSFAQDIPNGNFEAAISTGWNATPMGVATTTNVPNFSNQTTAITLTTFNVGVTYPAGIISSSVGKPGNIQSTAVPPPGSFPVSVASVDDRPQSLDGYFKYVPSGTDTAAAIVLVYGNSGAIIGSSGTSAINSQKNIFSTPSWTNINIPITYYNSTALPDSIKIIILSSSKAPQAGSVLSVDNLRFLTCKPDPSVTLATAGITSDNGASGISHDGLLTLPSTSAGGSYKHTFTISSPSPTSGSIVYLGSSGTYTINPLDSVIWNAITLPSGLTFIPGHPSNTSYGNSIYCFTISGNLPATTNTQHKFLIKQTPYGQLSYNVGGFSGGPTAANTLISNQTIDSIQIKIDGPVGITQFLDPSTFSVSQNVPNPFSGTTAITFSTPNAGAVQFTVVDMLGRVVSNQTISASAGANSITYAAGADSGTYFYTISDGIHSVTKKLVVYNK